MAFLYRLFLWDTGLDEVIVWKSVNFYIILLVHYHSRLIIERTEFIMANHCVEQGLMVILLEALIVKTPSINEMLLRRIVLEIDYIERTGIGNRDDRHLQLVYELGK